jgi:hypothetical protein
MGCAQTRLVVSKDIRYQLCNTEYRSHTYPGTFHVIIRNPMVAGALDDWAQAQSNNAQTSCSRAGFCWLAGCSDPAPGIGFDVQAKLPKDEDEQHC